MNLFFKLSDSKLDFILVQPSDKSWQTPILKKKTLSMCCMDQDMSVIRIVNFSLVTDTLSNGTLNTIWHFYIYSNIDFPQFACISFNAFCIGGIYIHMEFHAYWTHSNTHCVSFTPAKKQRITCPPLELIRFTCFP